MASELQRVAQELLECLDQIPRIVPYLQRLASQCRENVAMLAAAGSANPAARTAALQLDAAARACEQAAHFASIAPSKARGWAEQMVGGTRATDGPRAAASRPGADPDEPGRERKADRPSDPGRTDAGDGFDPGEMLKQLPKRDVGPGRSAKTRGIWRDGTGKDHLLVSGQHEEDYQAAQRHAERLGLVTSPHLLSTAADVELKFAIRMRREGIMNARIVLNREPCRGDLSCHTLLKRFLPPGGKLTVYAPDFEHTYEGEAEADGDS